MPCLSTGRAGPGGGYSTITNTLFTCLHTDGTIEVPANGRAMTRRMFYFLEGNRAALLRRFCDDFGL